MAEALMRQCIADRNASASVSSAGLLEGGHPCPPEIVALMASIGVDLTERQSRQLTADLIESADLVLTMEREHLREIAVMVESAWQRTFTLKEIVRRGTDVGCRSGREPMESWIARVHTGREPTELLGASSGDDVADPYGGTAEQYTATKLELESLVAEVADLIWPTEAAKLGVAGDTVAEVDAGATESERTGRRARFGLSRRR